MYILDSEIEGRSIVYAPLHKLMFTCDENAKSELSEFIVNGTMPKSEKLLGHVHTLLEMEVKEPELLKTSHHNNAVILLSEKCNLACAYCYARYSRTQDTLSKERIREIVDYVLGSDTDKHKRFTFLGGGEPTYTWDLLKWSIEYIRERSKDAAIGVVSNMTLIDEDRAEWLIGNHVFVSASFDILPDIQNRQRVFANGNGSFQTVDKNIKLLISKGFIPRIRATITEDNVCRMPEMLRFVIKNYPQIRNVQFEQATVRGKLREKYYDDFYRWYYPAVKLARENHILLTNSVFDSIRYLRRSFCNGEFCLTPSGNIVSCHRVSLESDPLYTKFSTSGQFGRDTADKTGESYLDSEGCSKCFAKWHCAGGCPYARALLDGNEFNHYCKFVQKILRHELDIKLGLDN